ncbi:helix-loop-helix protein 2-like [Schistocerca serialis cubense]|uniref:helix-loop-helix protein 2-like n=1 Tax=Schistocerca serialis cubense TaxID=2023355 RepID=UPI00214E0272|nr:helix-loop-helix protein 2-like [Schistocerca serialis cubense]
MTQTVVTYLVETGTFFLLCSCGTRPDIKSTLSAACSNAVPCSSVHSSCCRVTSDTAGADWVPSDDSGGSDDSSPRRRPRDPFLPENRIPLPGAEAEAERERQRVRSVSDAFHRLRRRLPAVAGRRPASKLEVLRAAIAHIRRLQALLAASPRHQHHPLCGSQ